MLKRYKYKIHDGDIVAGTIVHVEKTGFLVEIGTNSSGYLPKEEVNIRIKKKNNSSLLMINSTRDFFLMTKNSCNEQYILSLKRLDYIRAWKRIKQLYLEDVIFNLKIYYINKGGIITYLEGIQGFIPKSHIFTKDKISDQKIIKNKKIKCKLLSLNEHKNQLILSNKSAKLISLKHKFKLGELIYGKVVMQKQYGIFLNIFDIKALLHVSEIEHKLQGNDQTFICPGQFVKVKIIYLNIEQGLVSVSVRNVKYRLNHHPQY
uniref:30S ribosomal protein S1 n=1 Tax=Vertebrata lanosa TaxID=1261582 RepID=A0A0B5W307_9FLOR|nr:30S ribosomal protein S1 [Vertebrata lanosa]AJH66069.1 30S ribosomal protein S1 [Vertebrata lanosa]